MIFKGRERVCCKLIFAKKNILILKLLFKNHFPQKEIMLWFLFFMAYFFPHEAGKYPTNPTDSKVKLSANLFWVYVVKIDSLRLISLKIQTYKFKNVTLFAERDWKYFRHWRDHLSLISWSYSTKIWSQKVWDRLKGAE